MAVLASSSTASLSPYFAISNIYYKNPYWSSKASTPQVLSLPLGVKFQFPLCIWISRELMKRENKIGFVISCFVLLVWIVELMFEK
jgi:hypothetical protein